MQFSVTTLVGVSSAVLQPIYGFGFHLLKLIFVLVLLGKNSLTKFKRK